MTDQEACMKLIEIMKGVLAGTSDISNIVEQTVGLVRQHGDEARAEERRNVVEWLRTEDACRPGDTYLGWIAGRIERGEHLKAQEKQG